jgi:ornithine lipid ester-linked acyl 2-hydroxylase
MMKRIEAGAFKAVERLLETFAENGRLAFHDSTPFEWTREFERSYETIRAEAEALCRDRDAIPNVEEINHQQRSIVADRKWKTYFFHAFGSSVDRNLKACPGTAAALARVPNLSMAFFSILEPGTKLTPHRGIYKGVLRYHLGVKIPDTEARCGLTVDGEHRRWQNGKGFVFDDTFEHFAQNESNDYRVVLIVDFERAVPFWLRPFNRTVIAAIGRSRFVRDSLARANDRAGAPGGGGKSLY